MRSYRYKGGWCCNKFRCARLAGINKEEQENIFRTTMDRNFINLQVENDIVKCLVDSGASISCISRHLLHKVNPSAKIGKPTIFSGVGVCGEIHRVLGETVLDLKFGQQIIQQKFRIFETLHAKILLGLDFLRRHNVRTDFGKMTLTIPETSDDKEDSFINLHNVTVPTFRDYSEPIGFADTVSEVVIPPHSEVIIPVRVNKFRQGTSVIISCDQHRL